jgi:hypothetical protein
MSELNENNFVAGTIYEPLLDGTTRVRTFARGGQLISDEIMTDKDALNLILQKQGRTVDQSPGKKEAH